MLLFSFHLAKMERRAATRTRAERKMAAVREEAAMEGRLRARVMPRVSRAELPNVIFVPREFSTKKNNYPYTCCFLPCFCAV